MYDLYLGVMGTNNTGMTNHYDPMYQNHCQDDLLDQSEIKVSNIIQRYVFPIILMVGTVGNLTSIHYLHRLSLNVWSTCLYLTILAMVDLLILYVDCGNKWFTVITDINLSIWISDTSGAICKVYPFVYQFFLHFSPWIVVAASVELSIACRLPWLTYRMCTQERAKAVMFLITVLLVCINMHYFWTYGIINYAESPDKVISVCVYVEESSEYFRDTIWPFMNLAVGHVVPLLLVTTCFFVTISSFFRSTPRSNLNLEKYFMDIKSLQQLKITFTIITLFYITVITMKILLVVVNYLIAQEVIEIPCSMESHVYAVMTLLNSLWDVLFYLFLSVKFFIYMATCTRFRKDVRNFLCIHVLNRHQTTTSENCVDAKPLMQHGSSKVNREAHSASAKNSLGSEAHSASAKNSLGSEAHSASAKNSLGREFGATTAV